MVCPVMDILKLDILKIEIVRISGMAALRSRRWWRWRRPKLSQPVAKGCAGNNRLLQEKGFVSDPESCRPETNNF